MCQVLGSLDGCIRNSSDFFVLTFIVFREISEKPSNPEG